MDRNLELLGYSKCPRCGGELTHFILEYNKKEKKEVEEAICDQCGSAYILIYKNSILIDYVEEDD